MKVPFNGFNRLCPRKNCCSMEVKKAGTEEGDICFQMTFINQAELGGFGPRNNFKIETNRHSRLCDKFQDTSSKVLLLWSLPPSQSRQTAELLPLTTGSSSLLSGSVAGGQNLQVTLGTRTLWVKVERPFLVPSTMDKALQWSRPSLPAISITMRRSPMRHLGFPFPLRMYLDTRVNSAQITVVAETFGVCDSKT